MDLVCELHGVALRSLADAAGVHFQGVASGARWAQRAGLISPSLFGKLMRLDTTFHVMRHITRPYIIAMTSDLHKALSHIGDPKEEEVASVPSVRRTWSGRTFDAYEDSLSQLEHMCAATANEAGTDVSGGSRAHAEIVPRCEELAEHFEIHSVGSDAQVFPDLPPFPFACCDHENILVGRAGAVSCTGPSGAADSSSVHDLDSRPTAAAAERPSMRPSVWRVVDSSQDVKVYDSPSFVARVARTLPLGGMVRGLASEGSDLLGVPWVALIDEPGFVAVRTLATDFPGLGIIPARTLLEVCEHAEVTAPD